MRTEEWINDRKNFIPIWENAWNPPAAMLDFEEKWASFHKTGGRLMSCAHRGDNNVIYPENSLEGFQSVILFGTDFIEVDVHTAKDGTLIVMHDDTLTRTTNISDLRAEGKAQNLPKSDDIHKWTIDEIKQLRLKAENGDATEFAVPTLSQVISLAKGHCFITLDKMYDFNWESGIWPLLKEHSAYRTVLIPYCYTVEKANSIQQMMLETVGVASPYFAECVVGNGIMDPDKIRESMSELIKYKMPKMLRGGEFLFSGEEKLAPVLQEIGGNFRFYAETLRKPQDNLKHWKRMSDLGYNIIMANSIYELIKFTKQRHFSKD